MGVLRVAFMSGLLLSLAVTLRVVAGLVAEVLRDGRQGRKVTDVARPCACRDCVRATSRRAA